VTWHFEEAEITYGKKRESTKALKEDFSSPVKSLKLSGPKNNP